MRIDDYKTFERLLDAPYLSRSMISFILVDIFGATPYTFRKTFDCMRDSFRKEVKEKNLIDPGFSAVPRPIAFQYLDFIGVKEDDIRSRAKDYFDEGRVLPPR